MSFEDLENCLFKCFPEKHNNPRGHLGGGYRDGKKGRFDTMDESFVFSPWYVNGVDTLVPDECNCKECIEAQDPKHWRRYRCSKRLGQWMACNRIGDERLEDLDRLIHFYNIYVNLKNEGVRVELNADCKKVLKKFVKIENVKSEGPKCAWYSIVPKERLPYCSGNIKRLKDLCERCFTEDNVECCKWVIESGKHKDKPNLHIHALVKIGGRNKNFKRFFMGKWNKEFKDKRYNISYKSKDNCGWKMIPVNCWKMKQDKLDYMNNDSKGSHENFVDLGVSGGFGF